MIYENHVIRCLKLEQYQKIQDIYGYTIKIQTVHGRHFAKSSCRPGEYRSNSVTNGL